MYKPEGGYPCNMYHYYYTSTKKYLVVNYVKNLEAVYDNYYYYNVSLDWNTLQPVTPSVNTERYVVFLDKEFNNGYIEQWGYFRMGWYGTDSTSGHGKYRFYPVSQTNYDINYRVGNFNGNTDYDTYEYFVAPIRGDFSLAKYGNFGDTCYYYAFTAGTERLPSDYYMSIGYTLMYGNVSSRMPIEYHSDRIHSFVYDYCISGSKLIYTNNSYVRIDDPGSSIGTGSITTKNVDISSLGSNPVIMLDSNSAINLKNGNGIEFDSSTGAVIDEWTGSKSIPYTKSYNSSSSKSLWFRRGNVPGLSYTYTNQGMYNECGSFGTTYTYGTTNYVVNSSPEMTYTSEICVNRKPVNSYVSTDDGRTWIDAGYPISQIIKI